MSDDDSLSDYEERLLAVINSPEYTERVSKIPASFTYKRKEATK